MDGETGLPEGFNTAGTFDDSNIRRGFIRKVYGILTCQLAVTMVSFILLIDKTHWILA
jgi:FtsH-binding integral membrane protein